MNPFNLDNNNFLFEKFGRVIFFIFFQPSSVSPKEPLANRPLKFGSFIVECIQLSFFKSSTTFL